MRRKTLEILKYKAPLDFRRDCTLEWNLAFLIHSGLMIRLRLVSAPATHSPSPKACCSDPFQDCTGGAFIMQSETLRCGLFPELPLSTWMTSNKPVYLLSFSICTALWDCRWKYIWCYIKVRHYYRHGLMKLFVCSQSLISHSMFALPLYTSQQHFHSDQY